jgi:hypothetical protein
LAGIEGKEEREEDFVVACNSSEFSGEDTISKEYFVTDPGLSWRIFAFFTIPEFLRECFQMVKK